VGKEDILLKAYYTYCSLKSLVEVLELSSSEHNCSDQGLGDTQSSTCTEIDLARKGMVGQRILVHIGSCLVYGKEGIQVEVSGNHKVIVVGKNYRLVVHHSIQILLFVS